MSSNLEITVTIAGVAVSGTRDAIMALLGNSAPTTTTTEIVAEIFAGPMPEGSAPEVGKVAQSGAEMLAENLTTGATTEFGETPKSDRSERGKPLPAVKSGDAYRLTMEGRGFTVENGKVRVGTELVGGFSHLGDDESAARKEYRQRIKGNFRPTVVKSDSAPVKSDSAPVRSEETTDATNVVREYRDWLVARGERSKRGRLPSAADAAAWVARGRK